jgi:N-methylhydantoinase A
MNSNVISMDFRVGIDIGGTFTDIVFVGSQGSTFTKKVLSTPDDYSKAVATGTKRVMDEHQIDSACIKEVIHATTIVTNTCIELTGAKVGLITTKGFRDVLEIGRGRMAELYNLAWTKPVPLVPRYLRLEVDERVNKDGKIVYPVNEDEILRAIEKLISQGVEAVAICLYNSPKNSRHEEMIEKLLQEKAPGVFISRSTTIRPMLKEYERTSETVVNAYVMPMASQYLRSLRQCLDDIGVNAPLYVMQSSGGMITVDEAAEKPIEIVECGPAAGVVGAAYLAKAQGIDSLITLDLGGTTTKASIVENGKYARSDEYEVGAGIHRASRLHKGMGYVLRIPSIDIAEIGAGGGSNVWIDKGGLMKVGPRSSGASPGPACYNQGGNEPTLTDSYVLLGYMNSEYLLGGDFPLNHQKAHEVFESKVANQMKMSVIEAAHGAYRIANSNIRQAITSVSSERGRDPRKFSLVVFGGAGALHAVEVAKELGIRMVIIPPYGGIFSAFGLLCADVERNYVHAFDSVMSSTMLAKANGLISSMVDAALASAKQHGHDTSVVQVRKYADLRYKQQASEIPVLLPDTELSREDLDQLHKAFDQEHQITFGHSFPSMPLEVVNFRVVSSIFIDKPVMGTLKETTRQFNHKYSQFRKAYWGSEIGFTDVPVLEIREIQERPMSGPLFIDTYDTTIVVPSGCQISSSPSGSLIIEITNNEVAYGK